MEKHYVVPLTYEGKFSSDHPPDIPKTMTRPAPHVEGLSLLVIHTMEHLLVVNLDPPFVLIK